MSEDTGILVCVTLCPFQSLFVYGSSEEVSCGRCTVPQSTLCVGIEITCKVALKSNNNG